MRKTAAKKTVRKTARKTATKTAAKTVAKTAVKKTARPLTKTQLIACLAEKTELQKKQVAEFLETLADVAYKEAKKGFTLPGFGKLVLQKRKARMGRNPQTGEPVKIPAKTVVKFRISKVCKDAILGVKK